MVDLVRIELKLLALEQFFDKVLNESFNQIDIESATDGKRHTLAIKTLIDKYKTSHQNKLLKQIYARFTSIARGVEYFKDYETNKLFEKVCEGIYEIQQDVRENTKW